MTSPTTPARSRLLLYAGIAVVVVFVAAMLWQLLQTRRAEGELAEVRQQLAIARLEATLGAATIEAQQGSYELARQLASRFFTGLQASAPTASAAARPVFETILGQRDATITMLSRNDPQSAPVLARLFTQLRTALYGPERLDPMPLPAPGGAPAGSESAGAAPVVGDSPAVPPAPTPAAPADTPSGG